ncbi:hypothetical protein ACXET9_03135 [Brachybacterium sp. DNPG3]
MNDQLSSLLAPLGLALLGIALLAFTVWTRRGRTPAARAWMRGTVGPRARNERIIVLGVPSLAVLSLCTAAISLPGVGPSLTAFVAPLGVLAFLPLAWALMTFLPVPDALYPRWARPLRAR